MPRSTKAITNFTAGQFDKRLYGRDDIDQYNSGARTLKNVIVDWYGGASRTPGTRFVVEAGAEGARLLPFVFSRNESYVLECGAEYFRFFRDGLQIMDGSEPYELETPFDEDIHLIKFAQTADLMYLVHPKVHPQRLIRKADDDWTIEPIPFEKGPLLDINVTSTTITPSAATGTGITLTASTALFDEGHIGSIWKVNNGYVRIKTFTSATVVTADVLYGGNIGGTSAYTSWREGAWSDYRGYPAAVTFYEDRAVFAGSAHKPNTVWLSEPGRFEQFEGGADADDSITITVNARQLNRIMWLEPREFLVIGNEGGLLRLWSGSESQAITPSNISVRPIVAEGANYVQPITIASVPHYIQRDGRIVRALNYSLSSDNFFSGDVTMLSRDVVDDEIIDMTYQQAPHSIIWYVTESGRLVSSTIDINQKITAFSYQHDDNGKYKSVVAIPDSLYGQDEVWFIVERNIDGNTKQYIERLTPYSFTIQSDAFFVRSGITVSGVSSLIVSGASHLEGSTVSILAGGWVQPDRVVTSGAVTLDNVPNDGKVHMGLPYTSEVETLDLNSGSALGTGLTAKRHISKCFVKFYRTMGCKVGRGDKLDIIKMDKPATLFTGNKEITFPAGYDREMTVKIVQDQPLPMTVSAIYPYMVTNDR